MKSINILTGGHLCRNPRVVKEATTLARAGYRVTVFGPILTDEWAQIDQPIATNGGFNYRAHCDLRPTRGLPGRQLWWRVERRGAAELCRRGVQSGRALGYGVKRLLSLARRHPADLAIGHQEVGLWVVDRLRRDGVPVGVDFEDWYSEDLLPESRVGRPIALLQKCERNLIRHAVHATTTSHSLADALATRYNGPAPRVVYNAFPWAERAELGPMTTDSTPRLHWVSQTVGPGRGLETLCEALRRVRTPVAVHLRGQCSTSVADWLNERFPRDAGHTLELHPLVPPNQLLGEIAKFDIGLALERSTPPSRDLTVTNKILHYLLAGLAVVASDTAGQREVAESAGCAVRLFRPDDAEQLAAALNHFATDPTALHSARAASLQVAERRFSWERQEAVLLDSVERAIHQSKEVVRA